MSDGNSVIAYDGISRSANRITGKLTIIVYFSLPI